MTEDDFRALALSLRDAIEGSHMGHPDFRANGRIFASLHGNGSTGMVKLSAEEQAAVMAEHARVFSPSSGAWGRQGCTNVLLAAATVRSVRGAMLLAWERAVAAPPARPRGASATRAPRTARRVSTASRGGVPRAKKGRRP